MALISCGELSCLFILPIINSLLNFSNFELYKKSIFLNHPVIDCILSNFLLCFCFIPLIFTKICCNSKKNQKAHTKSTLTMKINNIKIFTIVIGFLYELVNLLHSIVANQIAAKNNNFVNDYIFELFFIVIASKIFSKNLIYKHQIISIIFIILLACGFYAIGFLPVFKEKEQDPKILIFLVLKQIIFGIYIVLIKHLTEFKKYSIFRMLLIFGLVGLLVDIIVLVITNNIKCHGELWGICSSISYDYKKYNNYTRVYLNETNITDINISNPIDISKEFNIENITNYEIIDNYTLDVNFTNITTINTNYYLDNVPIFLNNIKNQIENQGIMPNIIINIIYRLFTIISIFLCMIIVEKLFPSYTYFTNILLSIFAKIKDLIYRIYIRDNNDDFWIIIQILIQILIVCFIFFWVLVYNEIIELNCCGCSENLRKNLISRKNQDERRTSDWVTNKGINDADATLVDNNNDISHSRYSDDNCGTLTTVNNF